MRGVVKFEAAGQEYALQFTTNRLCQLEADSGEGIVSHMAKMDDFEKDPATIKASYIRMIFRAGLVGNFDLGAAGDLIDKIGLLRALELAGEALLEAFERASKAGDDAGGKPKTGAA